MNLCRFCEIERFLQTFVVLLNTRVDFVAIRGFRVFSRQVLGREDEGADTIEEVWSAEAL